MLLHVAVLLPLWQESTDWETVTGRRGQQWPLAWAGFASQLGTGPGEALLCWDWGQQQREGSQEGQRARAVGSAVGNKTPLGEATKK